MEKIGTGEFSDEEENWNDTSWSEPTVIEANTITQNRPIVTKPEQATSSHNARYNKFCLTLDCGHFLGEFLGHMTLTPQHTMYVILSRITLQISVTLYSYRGNFSDPKRN